MIKHPHATIATMVVAQDGYRKCRFRIKELGMLRRYMQKVPALTHVPPHTASRPCHFTPGTHWIGWVDPRANLDVEKRKFLTLPGLELWPLGRPDRSQSLYRLSYPGSFSLPINLFKMAWMPWATNRPMCNQLLNPEGPDGRFIKNCVHLSSLNSLIARFTNGRMNVMGIYCCIETAYACKSAMKLSCLRF
jgi:hypothetical protein